MVVLHYVLLNLLLVLATTKCAISYKLISLVYGSLLACGSKLE
jgi:hypothetical protein